MAWLYQLDSLMSAPKAPKAWTAPVKRTLNIEAGIAGDDTCAGELYDNHGKLKRSLRGPGVKMRRDCRGDLWPASFPLIEGGD